MNKNLSYVFITDAPISIPLNSELECCPILYNFATLQALVKLIVTELHRFRFTALTKQQELKNSTIKKLLER